jgi:hypothetical protein
LILVSIAYPAITFAIAGQIALTGSVWLSLAFVAAGALGFVAGTGARGSFDSGAYLRGGAAAAILLVISCSFLAWIELRVAFSNVTLDSYYWPPIGFFFGYLLYEPMIDEPADLNSISL